MERANAQGLAMYGLVSLVASAELNPRIASNDSTLPTALVER